MRRWRLTAASAVLVGGLALAVALLDGEGSHGRARPVASAARQTDGGAPQGASGKPTHNSRAAAGSKTGRRGGSLESGQLRKLISLGMPVYCSGPNRDEVALTFDDGPGPYTHLVIRKLRKHGVQATFFVVGRNIPLDPRVTRQERGLGAVGDHTFTHPPLTLIAKGAAEGEIASTRALLTRASGGPVFLFRPPYGARNATIDSIARANGLLEILWTVDSADSLGADYAQIERNVIGGLRGGSIILMHENHGQTVRALPSIFTALARKHLRAVSVLQLLTDHPPSLAQLRAGRLGCIIHPAAGLGGG
jgi:peptidoglycan/xylan/chitin deacetylase (PgdA/CDA1 family)